MNRKRTITFFLGTILIIALFASIQAFSNRNNTANAVDIYVGIDAAYDDMTELKERIDQVKDYTNLFILGSSGITFDETKLNEMCTYISACGLNFATYTHTTENTDINFNQSAWTAYAKQHLA